jgi:hypothetical protein
MAPELWLEKQATPATDLYAIGIMLFEALAGRAPFEGRDTNALRNMHCFTPAPRINSLNSTIPGILDGIIKKLLNKDPLSRYQTAREVLDALETISVPAAPMIGALADRIRQHHDAAEAASLEQQRAAELREVEEAKNRYKEHEIIEMVDDVIAEINQHLPEVKIAAATRSRGKDYRLGDRALKVRFFQPNELFANPIVPGRMKTLIRRNVVHGGFIEITERGQDREGWNLVLLRDPEDSYGKWQLIETRVSAVARRSAPFEPFATEAQLLADNLANHWAAAMHVYNLSDKLLERADIVKILDRFIPRS